MRSTSIKVFFAKYWKILLVFFSVFGPATITAFADNDASGVATYSIAGAKLGYPILFLLPYITILLGITQEMGIRLAVVTRKGLGDLIRERWGVGISLIVFTGLLVANLATVVTEMAAIKAVGAQLGIPAVPIILGFILLAVLFVTRGKYKHTQIIMLFACLFFLVYIFAAIKVKPDWQTCAQQPDLAAWGGFHPGLLAELPDHRHGCAGHHDHPLGTVLYQQLLLLIRRSIRRRSNTPNSSPTGVPS